MMIGILDTHIIVDLLRGYAPAQTWVRRQSDLGIGRAVHLEVIEGAVNSQTQTQSITLLNQFELIELTVSDLEWATRRLVKYRLSHNVDAFDCIIAAPAFRLQLPLYTRNLKHFTPALGNLAQQPY